MIRKPIARGGRANDTIARTIKAELVEAYKAIQEEANRFSCKLRPGAAAGNALALVRGNSTARFVGPKGVRHRRINKNVPLPFPGVFVLSTKVQRSRIEGL